LPELQNSIVNSRTIARSPNDAAPDVRSGLGSFVRSSAQDRPRVSVVIVTYGSSNELPDCLDGLLKQPVSLEVFLVDNASPDDTPQRVAEYARNIENVHAILNPQNEGLAAGNNIPKEMCRGEYVLMLNPDTVFRDDSLARMVDFLDKNPDIGVVGPRNVYPDGSTHSSCGRKWGLLQVFMWRVLPYRIPRLLHDRVYPSRQEDVLFVSGSCLLIRRSIFNQIGGYDPEYFLCIEDVCDLCMRTREAGHRIVFLPDLRVVHLTGRSAVQAPYIVVWHGNRGTIYHFLKHKGVAPALLVSSILGLAALARVGIASVAGLFSRKYRAIARIYARVFWSILTKNPIRIRSWRSPESGSPTTA